jgi:hypothetical protein
MKRYAWIGPGFPGFLFTRGKSGDLAMEMQTVSADFIKDLGDGLVMRRSRAEDREKLSKFNAEIHKDTTVGDLTMDLMSGNHPGFGVDDFTIIENAHSGEIISTMCLIDQCWTYAGIPIKVGRPELVGTLPDYRNRGLVRKQFEVIHQWSQDRGQVVQAITGIPYYYRLFGYEMAMSLDGGRFGTAAAVPVIKPQQLVMVRLRPAVEADLPFISACYAAGCQRDLVACTRSLEMWRFEMLGKSPSNADRRDLHVIENSDGELVGFIGLLTQLVDQMVMCWTYDLNPGTSWLEVTPFVIRYIWDKGQALAVKFSKPCSLFAMWLHDNHPVFQVAEHLFQYRKQPYTWYLRVPDLPGFMRLIAPVLEQRLRLSYCTGYSGKIELNFYKGGLRMAFNKGCLVTAEDFQATPEAEGDVAFPGLSFLQLLFGYRSLAELRQILPDCWVDDKSFDRVPVLNVLFPKQNSNVWPIA